MRAESIVYRSLTQNEFKAINDLIQSANGGSQTYIDFPKGSITDKNWEEFFNSQGEEVANGRKWIFKVNSLSLGYTNQDAEISCRRDNTNSLRNQNRNRIKIWLPEHSSFPTKNEYYDESQNPIVIYLIKDIKGSIWAGWFYPRACSPDWYMDIELAAIFFNRVKGASGYIKFSQPKPFNINNYTWPFQLNDYTNSKHKDMKGLSLQLIYYGAPGTGKSNTIKINTAKAEDEERVYRTTFHPDSDYSTFVGCYKPSMKPTGEIMASGVKKEVITYKFVPQAFARAYVKAWSQEENVYLIIEEINRGNCAQIFGDLFQLLDRKNGVSEYPIDADTDFADYIREELGKNSKRTDFPKGVKEGKKLVLPSNLYIWATMNTSDQSLFPIDSAFKRRWEWVYIPIKNHQEEDYKIEIGGYKYDWWLFLEKINIVIGNTTSSEDKKLGYFFAKADGKIISAKQFVGKVLFYLWNDVFKNYAFDNAIFDKGNNKKFVFSDFFLADGEPDPDSMNAFMKKLDETITLENKASMILVKPEPAKENQANTEEPSATEEPADTEA